MGAAGVASKAMGEASRLEISEQLTGGTLLPRVEIGNMFPLGSQRVGSQLSNKAEFPRLFSS
jgi:hypothetical protein